MPQLSQIGAIYASQLFWLAIVFGLIYFGIGKAMVPKIERTIDDRRGRIAADLAVAAAARATAENADLTYRTETDAARSQATKALAEAKAEATRQVEAKTKAGDAASADRITAAMERIGTAKAGALADIEAATSDAVQDIVARLSGVAIDRDTIEAKVGAELAHV